MTSVAPIIEREIKYPRMPDSELLRIIEKAKSLLILDHPFFGASVAKRPVKFTTDVPTAAMAPTGQMYINLDFVSELRLDTRPDKIHVPYVIFLLAHEAMHFMLMHGIRMKGRDPRGWNIACDKVINDLLDHNNVGEPIPEGVYMRDARNYAEEELYDDQPSGGGSGSGEGEDEGGIGLDDIMGGEGMTEAEVHECQAQAKIETLQNAKVAKAIGKLPASLERLIEEMVKVVTPWYDILERYMNSKIKDDATWRRPNRRFMHSGIYLPSADTKQVMGSIVIAVDTSGSVSQDELNHFAGHINRILETCVPVKAYVVYCDARVNHVDEYDADDFPIELTMHGGGGTAFEPVFEWVDENVSDDLDCVIYLTDGWANTDFPAPEYDVIWLSTDRDADNWHWGEVVKYDMEAST